MSLWHWLFPLHCPFCSNVIHTADSCCDNCKKKYSPTYQKVNLAVKSTICVSPYFYDDPYKYAVWKLKFKDKPDLAAPMAKDMVNALHHFKYGSTIDMVTFVPLSKKSKRARGYNQSQLLARAIAKQLNIPCRALLKKTADNLPQHKLAKAERRKNVLNVYAATAIERFKNKNILLVDDICTTGATLEECTHMLKLSGAGNIVALVYTIVEKY